MRSPMKQIAAPLIRVSRLFRSTSLLAALLLFSYAARGAESDGGGISPVAEAEEAVTVGVFYATNRKRADGEPTAETYGGERGEPHFGRCEAEFTPIPFINQLASKMPFHLPSETNALRVVEQADPDAFLDQLASAAAGTSSGSVVVFVHGYNYGFARTCRMVAELQRGLEGNAIVVMFSWPANGLPTDYVRDQADVEWSAPFLASFLDRLGERLGRERLQVLSHSLGTRGAVMALLLLRADLGDEAVAARLVLLAPDFDSQTFVELLPRLRPMTRSITLYASSNDTPLKMSRQLSGYPRLGEGGELLTLAEGMESIDVSGVGRYQIFGHEYFYYHPLVAADLVELLSTGRSAAERSGLVSRNRNGVVFWEMRGGVAP